MTEASGFRPLPAITGTPMAHLRGKTPAVFRQMASDWPAVSTWTFRHIASLAPSLPVQLVKGNREKDHTAFTESTLGEYLDSLTGDCLTGDSLTRESPDGDDRTYLKEFDLLKRFPGLRDDLRHERMFPRGSVTSCSTWIGPARSRTGLHHDLLDNLAVQITGRKRFYLARPGTVERAGALSAKYDAWARLSRVGIAELAAAADPATSDDFFAVDLEPGDVLYVPARWWHEVVNLSAGILLSGFFGSTMRVTSLWARVRLRDTLHRAGLLSPGNCTCHADRRGDPHR
ncbi:Cupin-like domain-containing protein [Streptomyces sp. cf386]|uniref:cupin-like domain-containing protein n=1 Tax=Streptomyces sp. cf386 TaxID=1761904 RepID=UPI00087FA2A8|nr:cupin-like domain-containing protein [Streptomyces sp. cf386]SDN22007.1 Cupin-like domain-containing protein [Streptomyces sp. cf386]